MSLRAPAPLRAARSLRVAAVAWVCVASLAPSGCDNPNEMFMGRWESDEALQDEVVTGFPVLAIGHYGREVAGVAYFGTFAGAGQLVEACPCAFIEHRDVDLGDRTLEFNTSCDGTVHTWNLLLEERGSDLFLVGTVRPADSPPGEGEIEVELENKARFVRDEDRECPLAGS